MVPGCPAPNIARRSYVASVVSGSVLGRDERRHGPRTWHEDVVACVDDGLHTAMLLRLPCRCDALRPDVPASVPETDLGGRSGRSSSNGSAAASDWALRILHCAISAALVGPSRCRTVRLALGVVA